MDRETVIDRLNDMADYLRNKSYSDLLARDFYDTVGYALALLKEQEAVEPVITPWAENEDGEVVIAKRECGRCGCQFFTEKPNYCENCGAQILWEGR